MELIIKNLNKIEKNLNIHETWQNLKILHTSFTFHCILYRFLIHFIEMKFEKIRFLFIIDTSSCFSPSIIGFVLNEVEIIGTSRFRCAIILQFEKQGKISIFRIRNILRASTFEFSFLIRERIVSSY